MDVIGIVFAVVAILGLIVCLVALLVQHKHIWEHLPCFKKSAKPLLEDVHIEENRQKAQELLGRGDKVEAFKLYKMNARSITDKNQLCNQLHDVDFDFRGLIAEEAVALLPEILALHENGGDTMVIETPANALRPDDPENELRKVVAKWLNEKGFKFDERFPGVFRINLIRTIS